LDEVSGRALVEAWLASGLSGSVFCRARNLRGQRLHYWRERLGYPMRVVGDQQRQVVVRPPATDGFVQVVVRDPPPLPTTAVDIVVGAVIIRVQAGFDAGLLRSVIAAVGSGV
jgi:hypothetical protein